MRALLPVIVLLLLGVSALRAETGDITVTGTGQEYYGIRVNIPFGTRFDYNDILVTRVIDGAALKLADGAVVRLIGVGVPPVQATTKMKQEAVAAGKDLREIFKKGTAAAEFLARLVRKRSVRLEFDQRVKDANGCLLAYVYVKRRCTRGDEFISEIVHGDAVRERHADHDVDLFVNAEILKAGHGDFVPGPPNIRHDEVLRETRPANREMTE